jgi:choline transport protein
VQSQINPRFSIPLNAIGVAFLVCVILSLVNLGSLEAFNGMLSLNQCAILGSYMIGIGCKIYAGVQGSLPGSPWSLGRYGLYVDVLALLLLAPLFVFAVFPGSASVNAVNMNWGVLMFGSVVLLSTIYFFVTGRDYYVSPRQRKDHAEETVAL